MPLTDDERRFLDHYTTENQHFEIAPMFCVKQLGERSTHHGDILTLFALRQEEWKRDGSFICSLEFITEPRIPETPTPCPWPDRKTFLARVEELTRLSEENAFFSRDFTYHERCGFLNKLPKTDHEPSRETWSQYLSRNGWHFRGRFVGIKRANVAESFGSVPVSVWDPPSLPPMATQCHYLALVETEPEPIRIWDVTRGDIMWFTYGGDTYLSIFPTPPAP